MARKDRYDKDFKEKTRQVAAIPSMADPELVQYSSDMLRYKIEARTAKVSNSKKAVWATAGALLCAAILAFSKSMDALAPGQVQNFQSFWHVIDYAWHYTWETWWPNQVRFMSQIGQTLVGQGTGIDSWQDVVPKLENILGDAAFVGHVASLIAKWKNIKDFFHNKHVQKVASAQNLAADAEKTRRGI